MSGEVPASFLNFASAMDCATPDSELLSQLLEIPEIGLCGFTVREGLAGGVTVLKDDNYFGSWRVSAGELVWVHANLAEPSRFVPSVDEAVRYTLLLILRNLETGRNAPKPVRQSIAS
jgi:hypothetical protein